jgi:tetratricopeptide (TPR) repeat protein
MTPDSPLDVEDVILAYLNAEDSGGAPDPSDWLARYPQFADHLAPFFAVGRGFARAAAPTPTSTGSETSLPGGGPGGAAEPVGLGDRFEWGGEVGRGGMGDVVRVRDTVLGRSVAVKVLQRRHRSRPHVAARFLEEARIAGGLQHPGVPPIHDVGTAPDGRPFMVMKLIEGSTLADLLRRRPDPAHDLPGLLKVFEQVAQTVAYAHSRGVIHRDLKPHNVMVGAFGEVQVMDWGLARFEAGGQETGADTGPDGSAVTRSGVRDATRAGTVIGTPAYMAPEQARGETDRLDTRADVFGLGAVLCEVLTGRPPFAGEHPLEEARRGDVADALRRLEAAGCDPELAELARRCLDPDPARRPADGEAVAGAIVGYLAGVQERLRQTELAAAKAAGLRRQRRLVRGLGALAVLLIVVGLSAVLAVQAMANADLTRKNDELAAANERERLRFNLALDAIGLFHGEVSRDLILKEGQFKPLRTKLLGGATDFYTRLETQIADQGDATSQAALARVYAELGGLHDTLGNFPAAADSHDKALAIRRRLAAAPGADRETRLAVAATLYSVGNAQRQTATAGIPASEASLGEALAVAGAVESDQGVTFDSRTLVSDLLYLRATNALNMERAKEAVGMYRQVLAILEPLLETHPKDLRLLRRLGDTHIQIALSLPNVAAKRTHLRQALGYYQTQLEQDRTHLGSRRDVAHSHMTLIGGSGSAVIPSETALAHAAEGCRLAAELVAEYPAVPEFRRVLAWCHYSAGRQHLMLNRPADARAAFEAARDHFQQLWTTGDVGGLNRLSLTRMRLADLDAQDGSPDIALRGYRQAEREMEEAIRRAPSDVYKAHQAYIVRRIGLVHLAAGHHPEAAVETRHAHDLLAPVWEKLTHFGEFRVELAACHATLAGLGGKPGSGVPAAAARTEADEAMRLLNTNTGDYYPHPRLLTGDPAFASLRGRPDFQKFIRDGEAIAEKARKDTAR